MRPADSLDWDQDCRLDPPREPKALAGQRVADSMVCLCRALVCVLLAGLIIISPAIAEEQSHDSQSQARFLINFAEFTKWPASAFANEHEPLTIGILGKNSLRRELEKLAENQVLRGRHVRISHFRKVEEINVCHILYISESEERRLERILRAVSERPLLTVSEIKNGAERGVMIEMKRESKKIRLAINLESAKAAHLTLKSKLLRLGEIVEPVKK